MFRFSRNVMEIAVIGALIGAAAYVRSTDTDSSKYEEKPVVSPITALAALPKAQTPPTGVTVSTQVNASIDDARGMFDPNEFGELSFKEFVMGGGGDLSAPDPKPEEAGWRQQPFFRSERTQGFNERTAQFKTDLYTGVTKISDSKTGVYRHREVPTERFQPGESASKVSFYGTAGQPKNSEEARRKYRASARMQGVLPFEQIRVGPGVGVGANVASSGGFHPFLRVMPHAVGDYKKNTLPGRIAPGRAPVDLGSSRTFEMSKKLPPRFYSMDQHPMAASGDPTSGISAPAGRPAEPKVPMITRDNVHPGDLRCPARHGSVKEPCGYGNAPLNPSFAVSQAGGPSVGVSSFGDPSARSQNNRTLDHGGRIGAGEIFGVSGQTAASIGVEKFVVEEGRFEKLTRDGTRPFSDFAINQASSARAISQAVSGVHQYNAPGSTLRDITGSRPYTTGVAVPSADRGGAVLAPELQNTFRQLDRHAKRGDQVRGWTPPASMTRADATTYGAVGIKNSREAGGRLMGGADLQVAKLGFDNSERGNDTRFRKADPTNVRLWNDLAAKQLRTNQFAKTLYDM